MFGHTIGLFNMHCSIYGFCLYFLGAQPLFRFHTIWAKVVDFHHKNAFGLLSNPIALGL
jgi:hypothetical protein